MTLEVTWEGNHTGNLATEQGTIPPYGKRVSLPAALVMEVEGDQIKTTRHYFDLRRISHQILKPRTLGDQHALLSAGARPVGARHVNACHDLPGATPDLGGDLDFDAKRA